jgi:hypothetical protein
MNDKESTLYLELLESVTYFARENISALEIDGYSDESDRLN